MSAISYHFRRVALCAPLGLALAALSGCGNDFAPPTPTPSATATGTAASFDVTPCLNQTIPGTGLTVAYTNRLTP